MRQYTTYSLHNNHDVKAFDATTHTPARDRIDRNRRNRRCCPDGPIRAGADVSEGRDHQNDPQRLRARGTGGRRHAFPRAHAARLPISTRNSRRPQPPPGPPMVCRRRPRVAAVPAAAAPPPPPDIMHNVDLMSAEVEQGQERRASPASSTAAILTWDATSTSFARSR